MSGVDGDTVTLSNTPSTNYTFNGYTVNGATLYDGNKFDFSGSDVTCSASWTQGSRGPMPTQGLLYLTDMYGYHTNYSSAFRKYYYLDEYRYSAIPGSGSTSYDGHKAIIYSTGKKTDKPTFLSNGTFGSSSFYDLRMPSSYDGCHYGYIGTMSGGEYCHNGGFPYSETSGPKQREYSTAWWGAFINSRPNDVNLSSCEFMMTNGLGLYRCPDTNTVNWEFRTYIAPEWTLINGEYGQFSPTSTYWSDRRQYVLGTTLDLHHMHHYNAYISTMDTSANGGIYELYLDGKLLFRIRGNWDSLVDGWDYHTSGLVPLPYTYGHGMCISEWCLYEGRVIHYPDRPIVL